VTKPDQALTRLRWLTGTRRRLLIGVVGLLIVIGIIAATQRRHVRRWLRGGDDPLKEHQVELPVFAVAAVTDEEQGDLQSTLQKPWRTVWSLLDSVSLYQRAGYVEHYGTDFRERRTRPVAIDCSVFHVNADGAFLMWWPERTPAIAQAELLEIAFAGAAPTRGTVTVGLLLQSGETYTFGHAFAGSSRSSATLPFFPEDFQTAVKAPMSHGLVRNEYQMRARLPAALCEQLRRQGDKAVRCWFLFLGGQSATDVAINHISLLAPSAPAAPPPMVTLAGSIRKGNEPARCKLSAILESGKVIRREVGGDGKFSVSGIPARDPVSLRVEYQAQEYYADAGRWFVPGGDRTGLVIHLSQSYENTDNHKPNPKDRVAHFTPKTGYSEMFAVHARQIWNGDENYPQQYDGKSFSNNIGHLDRDRFFDNADRCFRIVHLGSSHAVASQVRPCDRYNLLMETELGVRLGRPVEVISLGRNNGDLAANYIRVRDFAVKFKPDAVLLEHGSFLSMQVHPELLKRMHGYDAAHTHLDNFYYDNQGVLTHRPSCADWPLYVQKTDHSELVPGVPFDDTLRVPPEHMHPFARATYQYVADIMRLYQQRFPGMKIFLHTGLDQAQARANYKRTTKLADGTLIPLGAEVFMKNMDDLAARDKIVVLQPRPPLGFNDKQETYLTFIWDGHYSPRGHQWLAKELSEELIRALSLQGMTKR
jgi:hypothetical protein